MALPVGFTGPSPTLRPDASGDARNAGVCLAPCLFLPVERASRRLSSSTAVGRLFFLPRGNATPVPIHMSMGSSQKYPYLAEFTRAVD